MATVYVVSYEWLAHSPRKQWKKAVDAYASREDAEYSATLNQECPDGYRNVKVSCVSLYPAGIHAEAIARRKAREDAYKAECRRLGADC